MDNLKSESFATHWQDAVILWVVLNTCGSNKRKKKNKTITTQNRFVSVHQCHISCISCRWNLFDKYFEKCLCFDCFAHYHKFTSTTNKGSTSDFVRVRVSVKFIQQQQQKIILLTFIGFVFDKADDGDGCLWTFCVIRFHRTMNERNEVKSHLVDLKLKRFSN